MEQATDHASVEHCPRCGARVAADAHFCPACGERQHVVDVADGAAPADPLLARVRAALLIDYEVVRPLGRGRSAAVYLARDLRLARRVALKVLLPELAAASTIAPARFLADARTAATLDHPHVVPVYHAGEQDGLRYLAMRHVEGGSLAALLAAQGTPAPAVGCHLLAGVAAGLAHAHAQGVAHGDLRPANVLLDRRTGRALVADVGLTPAVPPGAEDAPYRAPERRAGDAPTVAGDLYAFGVLVRRLLDGRADAPPPLLAVAQRLTAAAPEERGPPLAELVPQLEAEAARALLADDAPTPAAAVPRPRLVPPEPEAVTAVAAARGLDDEFGQVRPETLEYHRAWLEADAAPAAARPRVPAAAFGALAVVAGVFAVAFLLGDRRTPTARAAAGGETERVDSAAVAAPEVPPAATAATTAASAVDSAPRADSALARPTLRIAPPARTRLPLTLRPGDSLRLAAVLVDSARGTSRPGTARWSSSAPAVVAVDADGWLRAGPGGGRAVITARADDAVDRLAVRVLAPTPEPAVAAAPAAPAPAALPGPDDVARLAERLAGSVGARDLGTLRALFEAWPGTHGAAPLLQVVERERDLKVTSYVAGEARVDGSGATLPLQVALKWRRGGLVRVVGVKTDEATARLEARVEREGGRWEVTGLRLAAPFRR